MGISIVFFPDSPVGRKNLAITKTGCQVMLRMLWKLWAVSALSSSRHETRRFWVQAIHLDDHHEPSNRIAMKWGVYPISCACFGESHDSEWVLMIPAEASMSRADNNCSGATSSGKCRWEAAVLDPVGTQQEHFSWDHKHSKTGVVNRVAPIPIESFFHSFSL